jgi:hypothetical protein
VVRLRDRSGSLRPGEAKLGAPSPSNQRATFRRKTLDMARLRRVIERLLEQLAIPTEDGKLIYLDMLCMSWAAVCDRRSVLSNERDSEVTDVEA